MSKAGEIAAAVGIGLGVTVVTVGVIAMAVACPEAFQTPPKKVVVVNPAPRPGVPAVRVPSGTPTVFTVSDPHARIIKVPKNYTHIKVSGREYPIRVEGSRRCVNFGNGKVVTVID